VAPESDAKPTVWGWDLAKAVDWTVGIPLDEDMNVCRGSQRFQLPWEEPESKILSLTEAPALIDSGGVGGLRHRRRRESGRSAATPRVYRHRAPLRLS